MQLLVNLLLKLCIFWHMLQDSDKVSLIDCVKSVKFAPYEWGQNLEKDESRWQR